MVAPSLRGDNFARNGAAARTVAKPATKTKTAKDFANLATIAIRGVGIVVGLECFGLVIIMLLAKSVVERARLLNLGVKRVPSAATGVVTRQLGPSVSTMMNAEVGNVLGANVND